MNSFSYMDAATEMRIYTQDIFLNSVLILNYFKLFGSSCREYLSTTYDIYFLTKNLYSGTFSGWFSNRR